MRGSSSPINLLLVCGCCDANSKPPFCVLPWQCLARHVQIEPTSEGSHWGVQILEPSGGKLSCATRPFKGLSARALEEENEIKKAKAPNPDLNGKLPHTRKHKSPTDAHID
eukprot:5840912-Amphidinium_carterae.1